MTGVADTGGCTPTGLIVLHCVSESILDCVDTDRHTSTTRPTSP